MSDIIASFDPASAADFNQRNALKTGWYGQIPEAALNEFMALRADALSDDAEERGIFAGGVAAYQLTHLDLEDDGMFGQQTWRKMLQEFDFVDTNEAYVMHKGRRIKVVADGYKLICFDEPGSLELHTGNDYSMWKHLPNRELKKIVLHWGGHDAAGCRDALFNRDVSSHFGIQQGVAYQWLDLGHKAWHASWGNKNSIGIDICQQPTIEHLDRYLARGLDVKKVKNPAWRNSTNWYVGEKVCLSLDSQTAETTYNLCKSICEATGIPFSWPTSAYGIDHEQMSQEEFDEYEGILWHSKISTSGRWDTAPWMGQMFIPGFEYELA